MLQTKELHNFKKILMEELVQGSCDLTSLKYKNNQQSIPVSKYASTRVIGEMSLKMLTKEFIFVVAGGLSCFVFST